MLKTRIMVDLRDLERLTMMYPKISMDVRESKLTEAMALLERAVKLKTPEGAGPIHLRDSIHPKVSISGKKVKGLLGTPLAHGEPREFGTKPHFPPIGPIQHWVEKKLGKSGDEAKSIAFAIAITIARRGTKGAHMFDKGFEENEAQVKRILESIPAEIITRLRKNR
ncbi:MAG: hypothetical protein JRD05_00740 [Deltaproteobacteria bacterium]|nr:hypothetical protein [Deltaproteobacteria bacterium]